MELFFAEDENQACRGSCGEGDTDLGSRGLTNGV